MVFDPTYPEIDVSIFKGCAWKNYHPKAKEIIPDNAPKPRGKKFDARMFVNYDHNSDTIKRMSRTFF